MTRLNVLLLLVLLVSCGYLVTVAHESRQLFADLDKTQSEARLLDSDYERLKSEKQSQATPLRVEKTAREKLAMRGASPAVTRYVTLNAASASASASATGGAR